MNARKRMRVAVNGYGVIGKRVADAVARHDMQHVGVADVVTDWRPTSIARTDAALGTGRVFR